MEFEELKAQALEYWDIVVQYVSQPELLFQVGLIVVLFLPAWFLSNRVEPLLEKQARRIKGMPGTLRIVVAFLRRMEWLFFVILLGLAVVGTEIAGWPSDNYLIEDAMLLAGAWLLISVASHAIRRRIVRRVFALIVWVLAAALILDVVDRVSEVLKSVGFSLGDTRITLLLMLQTIV